METLVNQLTEEWAKFAEDAQKNVEGNKAAGGRARKSSLALEKLLKEFRKESVAASK